MNAAPRAVDFDEDTYGSVKRVVVFRQWIEQLRTNPGHPLKILDYGCGTGERLTVPLAAQGDEVLGVDVHEPSIRSAQARHVTGNVTFTIESASELISAGREFDVIVCSEVLEHLHRPGDLLREFRALLRPNGELFVTVPNGYGAFENLRRVESVLDRVGVDRVAGQIRGILRAAKRRWQGRRGIAAKVERDVDCTGVGYLNFESGHVQFFRPASLLQLFESAGFSVIEERGRTVLCGPYIDFFAAHLPLTGRLLLLNGTLADRLPLVLSAGWMFRLRKIES